MIKALFSKRPIKLPKNTNEGICKRHCDDYPRFISEETFIEKLNNGYVLFPGGNAQHPLKDSSHLQVMFFDFNLSEKNSFDKKTILTILYIARLTPSFICDTYDVNCFRIAYFLEGELSPMDRIKDAFQTMFNMLNSLKVDINNSHANGYIDDCRNITILSDKPLRLYNVQRFCNEYTDKIDSICKALRNGIIVPTHKEYENALNILENNIENSYNAAYLKYDESLKNIDLMWLKILFTMHCREMSEASVENNQTIYSIPLSQIGKYADKNIYINKGKSVKSAFNMYNHLRAAVKGSSDIPVLKNAIKDGVLYYNGTYFNYLKKELYVYQGNKIGIHRSSQYFVIHNDAFKGNNYGEMIAEQMIKLIISFKNSYDRKYPCSDIIDMIPMFKRKIESLPTAKEKNVYLKRAFETAVKIVNNGWYSPCLSYCWQVECEIPTSTHLENPITFKRKGYYFQL